MNNKDALIQVLYGSIQLLKYILSECKLYKKPDKSILYFCCSTLEAFDAVLHNGAEINEYELEEYSYKLTHSVCEIVMFLNNVETYTEYNEYITKLHNTIKQLTELYKGLVDE